MKILILSGTIALGFGLPLKASEVPVPQISSIRLDTRAVKLGKFFEQHNCPKPYYIDDYLSSSDKYNISYTLLPSIAIIESQCGRHFRYNNFWGWNSAKTGFKSVAEGIDFVLSQLANGRYYKNKTLEQKLKSYNSVNPTYGKTIKSLMVQIDNE